ncbi:SH3 domain-containing protein [Geomesophilobacter sediminis]|nr:SH3 domain-containing protein [Geomesophilobacter sediminis]
MKKLMSTVIVAGALTALAAPVFAESTTCTVTAPEIRLRKTPSKKAKVLGVLKKNAKVTTEGKCEGGWVKVVAEDGRAGYVGGWAIGNGAQGEAAAAPAAPVAKAEAPAPAAAPAAPKEIPNNEQLAIQITELRLNVLTLNRDMDKVKKDIRGLKVAVRGKKGGKKHGAKKG